MRPRGLSRTAAGLVLALTVVVLGTGVGRADAPAGRYTLSNGMVYDTQTRLTWQQTPPPRKYVEFDGTPSDATTYCASLGTGWRLPSVGELETLVDETLPPPAIDPVAFPATPSDYDFWSQSQYGSYSTFGWGVSFSDGRAAVYARDAQTLYVRCVRP